jgi:hypothetical protein
MIQRSIPAWKSTRSRAIRAIAAGLLASVATPAMAQSAGDLAELRAAVEALRADQLRSQARIAELEAKLDAREAVAAQSSLPSAAPATMSASVTPATQLAAAPAQHAASIDPRLDISGDMRVRYEANFSDRTARDRDRGVLRARLRATYAVNDWLTVGGQIATGDPDDPNSTDITLSNFADDLAFSLDQAYIRATFGQLRTHLGKMPLPFTRTDLVWDGDVSPQGASASYTLPIGHGGATLRANGLYFLVDESVTGPNSDMIGGQLAFESAAGKPWRVDLAVGYYDYALRSLAGADAGDFRSNRMAAGRYVSDFDLLDVIGGVTYSGLGARWPIRLVGDYVHNFGAVGDAGTGFGVDLLAGRASSKGDWRFGYGYAQADIDAVLAAFSHDNTNIATNYRQHSLSVDFAPRDNLILNATFYHYRLLDTAFAPIGASHDWLNRVRLNMLVNF